MIIKKETVSKAKTKLGWEPKYDFNSLIKEMVESDLSLQNKKLNRTI